METLKNALKIPELRAKLIFTFIIVILYRLGAAVPVPYINSAAMSELFASQGNTVFGYLNILSGNAFSRATLFALSITPYITASIIMQLLTIAIPALERLQKSGDDGRKKINQITRYVTVLLGLITGYGYYIYCRSSYMTTATGERVNLLTDNGIFAAVVIIACYSAGSALIMWLGEKINENGIGNGISIILFANIISTLPTYIINEVRNIVSIATDPTKNLGNIFPPLIKSVIIGVVAVLIVGFIVFMTNAEHRLPVQYSKRMVGRKMYGGQSTFLPIKVNMSGVMPIIFANSMVMIPITILSFVTSNNPQPGTVSAFLYKLFGSTSPLFIILTFVLIIAFSYFYISISFNPIEVSNNLKKNGGFIPGIRPGKPTSDYITKILNKVVLIGGLFLAVIAVFPLIVNAIASLIAKTSIEAVAFGGSSILIVVGVALETTRELEAQMTMRHHKGFLE